MVIGIVYLLTAPALVILSLLMPALSWGDVCETRPLPVELPRELRLVVDLEDAIGDTKPAKALPVGLELGRVAVILCTEAPDHLALTALFAKRAVKIEKSRNVSRRATANYAARRLARHLDEWEQEAGPLADTAQRWRGLSPDRIQAQIALDLLRMLPDLGWWSVSTRDSGKAYIEISAEVEISPLRLVPAVQTILWVDSGNKPQAVALRKRESGGLNTWFAVWTSHNELTLLKRISFQGNSRFDSCCICDDAGRVP